MPCFEMGLVATRPVFKVSDKVRFKQACSATGTSSKIDISFVASFPKKANNKGADQTAQMCRLVCAFVVRKVPKTGLRASRLNKN